MIKKLMLARRFITAGVWFAFLFVGMATSSAQLREGLVSIGRWT